MLKPDQKLRRNPDLVHANMGDETVLMSLTNGEYYGMNEVGSRIWTALEEAHSLEQLIDKLVEVYGITRSQCQQDIDSFLNALLEKGIVEII